MDTQGKGDGSDSCPTNAVVEDSRASTYDTQTQPAKKNSRGRPFRKGESGNRKGRPKGARNRSTILRDKLFRFDPENIIAKVYKLALQGKGYALELYIKEILPLMLDAPAIFRIPEIRTKEDAARAFRMLLKQHAKGDLTAEQAEKAMNLVERCVENLGHEGGARADDKLALGPISNVVVPDEPSMKEALQIFSDKTDITTEAATMSDEEAIAASRKIAETAS
jgi:hypothetical protein